jgi:hypothetical protein
MRREPVDRSNQRTIQSSGFLEQMPGTGNDQKVGLAAHPITRFPIEEQDVMIFAADDQQRWRTHVCQCVCGKVWAAAAGYDGRNFVRARCCSCERSGGTCAGTE